MDKNLTSDPRDRDRPSGPDKQQEYPPRNPPEFPEREYPGRESPHPGQPGEIPEKGPQGGQTPGGIEGTGPDPGPDDVMPQNGTLPN
jgi:hypothetical protein